MVEAQAWTRHTRSTRARMGSSRSTARDHELLTGVERRGAESVGNLELDHRVRGRHLGQLTGGDTRQRLARLDRDGARLAGGRRELADQTHTEKGDDRRDEQ